MNEPGNDDVHQFWKELEALCEKFCADRGMSSAKKIFFLTTALSAWASGTKQAYLESLVQE